MKLFEVGNSYYIRILFCRIKAEVCEMEREGERARERKRWEETIMIN
jgi:hypothetical protein